MRNERIKALDLLEVEETVHMDISRHWRLKDQRYGLTGTVCTNCGKRFFAPRPVCDECCAADAEVDRFGEQSIRRQPAVMIEPAQR